MRLANRVLLCVLAIFILSAVTSAQTPRSENDPRNQSPSVGTGGPPGGPTGLFTIYDGSTLRKGEYTFSIAYSNFDRDPGNVDITEVPVSFNIGLNDHLELFFKTTAYRGVKVNNPTNLSSFLLPNSQLFFDATRLGTGPAIILAPSGPNRYARWHGRFPPAILARVGPWGIRYLTCITAPASRSCNRRLSAVSVQTSAWDQASSERSSDSRALPPQSELRLAVTGILAAPVAIRAWGRGGQHSAGLSARDHHAAVHGVDG